MEFLSSMVSFLLLIQVFNLIIPAASLSGNETDLLALLDFKNQISDDPNGILKSWNASKHHCQWFGVTCGQNQRVIGLNLFGQSLVGSISPHVGNLTFMNFINLRNNRFFGEIPKEVGRLFQLTYLNLTNNSLGGEIPVTLSNCSQLKTIDILRNRLVGNIPFELGSLKKLKSLFLGRNNLTGEIPKSIGNLTSLTQIYLSYNNLEGHLPEELGQLTSLYSIGISVNFLSGTIPASLYNVSSVAGISLSSNSLEGQIPDNMGLTLPNIQEFLIGGNQFKGTIPVSLANASLLAKLDLVSNKFRGQVPTNLGKLPNLYWLNFAGNFLGSNSTGDMDFIASLSNCSNLQSLLFSQNNFGGTLPDSIGNLSHNLQQIDLALNQISGEIPTGLGNLANLYLLGMDHNLFSGSVPSFLGKFRMLQKLFLNNNQLSSQIPPSLFNMTSLYGLYLSENRLEGNLPSLIGNSQSLREMILSKNNLNGSIPLETFSFLSSLTLLNLTHNLFSGSLPSEIGKLTNIYFLDISYNQFSGEIPETIADCTSLEYIYMQGNSFQGEIPQSLASVKGIRVLDLAQNNLTGQIPKDLDMLPFVQLMNLSFNALEGEVPTVGFFANASSLSLTGNSKLCGGIPELKLPLCPEEIKKRRKPLAPGFIVLIVVFSFLVVASATFCLIYVRRKRRTSFVETDNFSGISYHELHEATKGFSTANLIGSGSFGSVYKGKLPLQGERSVAVKVLDLQKNGACKSFLAECIALRNIRHRNLVKVLTCCSGYDFNGREFKALVYEFMSKGDLDMWLHKSSDEMNNSNRALSLLQRLNIAIDVAFALDYLHNQCEIPVVHCDLKPCNVLLDDDLTAHVGDFGLARLLYENTSNPSQQPTSSIGIKGSLGYAAPEYGMGSQASTLGDVYSYGILLLELLTGRRPTDQLFIDGLNLHEYVKQTFPQIWDIVDPVLFTKEEEEGGGDAEEDDQPEITENNKSTAIEKEVEENTRSPEIDGEKLKCLRSLFAIGLSCSSKLPRERMDMKDVVKKLIIIKNVLVRNKITS
ncbi:unnamed protein product [Coffea canephora]|uniref:non-specific serine/threonine protein kinase n=1 Tax=Coffea canephora TaxID=49390 RepID=A0A068V1C8_COFCA|nr:unnamed protein product [Coffea canephora]